MSTRKGLLWDMQPHTAAKHEILHRYLSAWLPILARWHGRVVYIDGFAGPGVYRGGEPGSPIVALHTLLGHKAPINAELVCIFIEEDEARLENLRQEVNEIQLPPNIICHLICGKFDSTMIDLLDEVDRSGGTMAPTFAFVDPFGWLQTPMSVIQRLLSKPRCEVFVTVIYEELNRFVSWNPSTSDARDALFGTPQWRRVLQASTSSARRDLLRDLYEAQLRTVAGAAFVRSFELLNRNNATDILLFFATNHQLGLRRMKEAMWGIDPTGYYRFSDITNRDQPMLFEAGPDVALLRRLIQDRFQGRSVPVEEVERFVVEETPFRETHYKRGVLKALEEERPQALSVATARPGRRRGSFPPGTVVRFV